MLLISMQSFRLNSSLALIVSCMRWCSEGVDPVFRDAAIMLQL